MTLWFATGNDHKRKELAAILVGHIIKTPADAGYDFNPDENGATFLDNALIKARALYDLVKEPVIADDSGICVDALGGRPGVFSARYGTVNGQTLDTTERNHLLIRELSDIKDNFNRKSRFVCCMVLMLSLDRYFVAQETLEGEIIHELRGNGGFGYDPILYLPEHACTVAELSEQEKNRVSHRGKAALALSHFLKK
ncbi:RdgB/HAM1 family non-canonical purine NTP pyrophosphatase [Treponema sp.]